MLYTEEQKKELEQVREVFAELLKQSPDYDLLWSDKLGYVWLETGGMPCYVDTATRIDSAEHLCREFLENVVTDVLFMTGNDHPLENADLLELAEIKKRWEPYIDQLPQYAYLCDRILNEKE